MNVRDPFNLRRSPAFNILRGTATQAAANLTQRAREAGAQAYETGKQAVEDMSFSIPKNVPSFTNPQRELENRVWGSTGVTARPAGATGGAMSGMQDRVGSFFDRSRGDLPMYKDKPYSYASSRRHRPIWRRKRSLGIAGLFLLAVFYFLGFFSGAGEGGEENSGDRWNWLHGPEKGGSKIDWLDRRERVKEAFTLSWDAYDRYAWGMLKLCGYATVLLNGVPYSFRIQC
jgi:endoplasmic reticulum Man9GlcNAc2 1,2-alpha-mannosidase